MSEYWLSPRFPTIQVMVGWNKVKHIFYVELELYKEPVDLAGKGTLIDNAFYADESLAKILNIARVYCDIPLGLFERLSRTSLLDNLDLSDQPDPLDYH